jgi:rhamnose transport system ATP-binding protein
MKARLQRMSRYTWELILMGLLIAAVISAARLSPLYLDFDQIAYSLQQAIAIVGILGIGFMMVILLGEIDISLPAILAIGTVFFARLSQADVPIYLALPLVLAVASTAGALNGFLVVNFNVPSLAVTLGTMYAFRGLALFIGGYEGYAAAAFQPAYIWLGGEYFFDSIPISLCLLLLLFVLFWFVLQRTVFGRLLFAAGNNRVATRFSGYNEKAIVIAAFTVAGALSGLAALVYVGQFESARADNAAQLLLFVVACVVLGGFEIMGGKGNVWGLALALLLIGTVQNGMGLANIGGPVQTLVIGLILIGALLIPVVIRKTAELSRKEIPADASAPSSAGISGEKAADPAFVASAKVDLASQKQAPRMRVCNLNKSFGGIHALHNVSFDIMPGEIHALVGENGAGKSTLVKTITGLQAADSGEIVLDGQPVQFHTPMEARKSGVLAVYQDPKLFPNLDVAENVYMGIHPITALGTVDRKKMYERTRRALKPLGVELNPHAVVAGLSTAEMQFVEFARALAEGVERLFILDEPTASLSPGDTEKLFSVIRQLRDRGTSILFISHRLEELEGLVDTITVLRDGELVATKPADTLNQANIVQLMVGRSLGTLYGEKKKSTDEALQTDAKSRETPNGQKVFRVEGLSQLGVFEDISFHVRKGEVVCLAGLVGAGRTEIAQTLFGITPPTGGRIFVDGQEVVAKSPRQMLRLGVAYLPEDREGEGLISRLSILKNMVLPSLGALSNFSVMIPKREHDLGEKYAGQLQVKAAGLDEIVSSLSGGNRQKVVLSKWLAIHPKVLMLDEPTHGIDVGTKAQVHQMIGRLAADKMGILMISSDLPEVLRVSDRILVISDGRLVAEFNRQEATQEKIMMAAAIGKGGGE